MKRFRVLGIPRLLTVVVRGFFICNMFWELRMSEFYDRERYITAKRVLTQELTGNFRAKNRRFEEDYL